MFNNEKTLLSEKSKYVLSFLWLLKQRISIAKLCFQMCFEFDSVSLTFIKYSDEYVIKVLCLFFNIVFSVLQTSFELWSDWTKEEGLPASGPFPCMPCCAAVMCSPLNPTLSQTMCMCWGASLPNVLGALFQLPQKSLVRNRMFS